MIKAIRMSALLLFLMLNYTVFAECAETETITTLRIARVSLPERSFVLINKNEAEQIFYWNAKTIFLKNETRLSEREFFEFSEAPHNSEFVFSYTQTNGKSIVIQAHIHPVPII